MEYSLVHRFGLLSIYNSMVYVRESCSSNQISLIAKMIQDPGTPLLPKVETTVAHSLTILSILPKVGR